MILVAGFLFLTLHNLSAAEFDGVSMPNSLDVAGTQLHLNGVGLRTYSFLRIRVYVAGLYLTQPTSNMGVILASQSPKILRFVFMRDVDADRARNSWRESFERDCRSGCRVSSNTIQRFLAGVPAMHRGDTSTLLFDQQGLEISINDHLVARISDPEFAALILTGFIGPHPASEKVRDGLLGVPQ